MNDTPLSASPPAIRPEVPAKKGRFRKQALCVLLLLALAAGAGVFFAASWLPPPRAATVEVGGQTAALQAQLDHLTQRVKALEERAAGNAAVPAVPAPPQASRPASDAVRTDAATAVALDHAQADIAAMSGAIGVLQAEVKANGATATEARDAAAAMIASVVAFLQAREAATSGQAFGDELAVFAGVSKNDAALQASAARLKPYAAGVPTLAALREDLLEREPAVAVAVAKSNAHNWWERILAELQGLITVRPLHGGEGDALARLESALTKGGATAALEAFKDLPADAQQALADWKSRLEARYSIDQEFAAMAAHMTASPAAKAP